MAQPQLDRTAKEDTATLFRADADSLRLVTSSMSLSARDLDTPAVNQESYDDPGYERTAPGQPRKRKLTSDEDALAKKSGYQIVDERDTNGAQAIANGSTGSAETTAKAQTDMLRQAAATQSTFSRLTSTVGSLWNNYVADPVSRLWDSATGAFDTYIGQPIANVWNNVQNTFSTYVSQPLASAWQSTKDTFNEYVGQPVANFAARASEMASSALETTRSTFNEYVAQPASNLANRVSNAASGALESTRSTFNEYVAQPVSNLASSTSEMASNAWTSTKNFFGAGNNATAEQTAPQAVARREAAPERPTASAQTLSGEQNNPTTGFSLRSAFGSALDRASQALGLDNDGPEARAAAPSSPALGMIR